MRLDGTASFAASREQVWDVLLDPDALQGCLPGCESLTATDADTYEVVVKIGVASVKGTYTGTVQIRGMEKPHRYRLGVEGKGTPGFVNGEALVELTDAG